MNSADVDGDLALSTLLEVRDDLGLNVPDDLVRKIHAIQKSINSNKTARFHIKPLNV